MIKGKDAEKIEMIEDFGFGSKISTHKRFINKDGSLNVVRRGGESSWTLYHHLTDSSWGFFFIRVGMLFLIINSLFATIYVFLGVEYLRGVQTGSIWEDFSHAFFFSVQTFTTVGYGAMSPIGMATNWVASLESFVGLFFVAVVTGVLFSRFTKPKAQIIYSKNAVIAPYKGMQALMLRIANLRDHKIMNLEATISATWIDDSNGHEVRKYANLKLERKRVFLFPLSWTIVHPFDKDSPFYGKDFGPLNRLNVEFLVMLEGYDESYNQMIYSNTSYVCDEVIWNAKFKPMFYSDDEKGTILELDRINDYEMVEE